MQIKGIITLLFSGVLLAQAALANAAPAAGITPAVQVEAKDSYLNELARVNRENLLLKAQLQKLEMKAKLAHERAEIAKASDGGGNDTYGVPVVTSVEGIGKNLFATLVFANGSEMNAKAGERLPNGMRLLAVHPGNVVVLRGKHQMSLAFGTASGQQQSQQPTNSAMHGPLPPLPLPGAK